MALCSAVLRAALLSTALASAASTIRRGTLIIDLSEKTGNESVIIDRIGIALARSLARYSLGSDAVVRMPGVSMTRA
jgi:hypothetical protein